jgi:hypothetical protein
MRVRYDHSGEKDDYQREQQDEKPADGAAEACGGTRQEEGAMLGKVQEWWTPTLAPAVAQTGGAVLMTSGSCTAPASATPHRRRRWRKARRGRRGRRRGLDRRPPIAAAPAKPPASVAAALASTAALTMPAPCSVRTA